jgi:serine/threonine-protein kinase
MGEVYRARDPRLNREVAIKVLARAGSDPVRQRRFTGEAQAASALNHPNILTVYDVGVHDEVPYIVSGAGGGRVDSHTAGASAAARSAKSSIWACRWPTAWQRPTRRASCIATSNPRT